MTPAPPDIPGSPVFNPKMVDYLRRMANWARLNIDAKIDKSQATPGVYMQSPGGSVFVVGVGDDGRLTATPIQPGSGKETTPVLTFAPVTTRGVSVVINPPATASTTYVTMGFAVYVSSITSSAIWVTANGQIINSAANGETNVVICYGTGTAPPWGALGAGTIASQTCRYKATAANDFVPFSLTALIQNLVPGQGYWIDLAVKVLSGTGMVMNVGFAAMGLP